MDFTTISATDVKYYVRAAFSCIAMQDAVYTQIMNAIENNRAPEFNDINCNCKITVKPKENGEIKEEVHCLECHMTADQIKGRLIAIRKHTCLSDLHVK